MNDRPAERRQPVVQCPKCGSKLFRLHGYHVTKGGKVPRRRCIDCDTVYAATKMIHIQRRKLDVLNAKVLGQLYAAHPSLLDLKQLLQQSGINASTSEIWRAVHSCPEYIEINSHRYALKKLGSRAERQIIQLYRKLGTLAKVAEFMEKEHGFRPSPSGLAYSLRHNKEYRTLVKRKRK